MKEKLFVSKQEKIEAAKEIATLTLLGVAFVAAHYTAYAFGW